MSSIGSHTLNLNSLSIVYRQLFLRIAYCQNMWDIRSKTLTTIVQNFYAQNNKMHMTYVKHNRLINVCVWCDIRRCLMLHFSPYLSCIWNSNEIGKNMFTWINEVCFFFFGETDIIAVFHDRHGSGPWIRLTCDMCIIER